MAIYRPEMARFTFGSEKGHGGYQDTFTTGNIGTNITNPTDLKAGDRHITLVDAIDGLEVGDYVEIGPAPIEIRRILAIDATNAKNIYLDYPLGYGHDGAKLKKIELEQVVALVEATGNASKTTTNIKYIPGVYDSVQVPDLTPEFIPKYFLKTENDRNWSYMYRGRQTFNGSVPDFILLDGRPLRFALGTETPTKSGTDDAPVYIHKINETAELSSMTWNLELQSSDKDSNNIFTRRYLGGLVNRATISANEGEYLRMGWDDVQFLDLVHNQLQMNITDNINKKFDVSRSSAALVHPDIVYPDYEPYYFSTGELKFFGYSFARIRNFRIEINNNIEARYYIDKRDSDRRGPSEFLEQQREYTMTVSLGMEDTIAAATDATTDAIRTIWKELILEGNYKGYGQSGQPQGFTVEMQFTRGPNDHIKIVSPHKANVLDTPGTAFESQGCFFRRATHTLGEESPIQIDGEIILRNLGITVVDKIATYP